jgi:hypothetical protein
VTLHTTRWTPDTCGCVVEYQWDDAVPDDQRTHTVKNMVACPAHVLIPTHDANFDAVIDENSRKNLAKSDLLSRFPVLAQTIINADGSTYLDFKPGITASFTQNFVGKGRVLTITFPAGMLTAAQKSTAQATADNRFGTGRVIIL